MTSDHVWGFSWCHVCLISIKFSDNVGMILFFIWYFLKKNLRWTSSPETAHFKCLKTYAQPCNWTPLSTRFRRHYAARKTACPLSNEMRLSANFLWCSCPPPLPFLKTHYSKCINFVQKLIAIGPWGCSLFRSNLKVIFLSSPIACVACERTELLRTEIGGRCFFFASKLF